LARRDCRNRPALFISTSINHCSVYLAWRKAGICGATLEVSAFTDYYEVLEVSPNANSETIDRIFRYFAHRYHPDNPDTGNRACFDKVVEAFSTLRDPVKRAQYDILHIYHWVSHRELAEEASDSKSRERDADIQGRLLSILYAKRRRDMDNPGMGKYRA